MMLHHIFHRTRIWYELLPRKEDTICALNYFMQMVQAPINKEILSLHIQFLPLSYEVVTLVSRIRFCCFSGQLFFLLT